VIALAAVISGVRSMRARRRGRSWLVRLLYWLVTLAILPALGALYGYTVPAIIVLTATIVIVGYLYIALWLVIWAVGGGRIREIWPAVLVLLFPLFWPLIPILIGLLIPTWILGRLIQRFAFVDFKIAMRSMLATKGRGASTLMALVIGVFTLSVITMLVDTITKAFENLLEQATGGNIMIVSAGGQESISDIRTILTEDRENVRSFAIVGNFQTQLQSYWSARQNRDLSSSTRQSIRWAFESIDGREITSNLPDVTFTAGRNLDPILDNGPNAKGYWSAVYVRDDSILPINISVGDRFTVGVGGSKVQFEIVGVAKATIQAGSSANVYVPLAAFGDQKPESVFGIADVKEGKIRDVRRKLAQVPGTFVLETRFINDLLNRIVDQFTSFPILVAALALVTGGIVIANSVALSTLERRREIGIMKAVGLQRERVLGILLLENGLMGIVGGLIGVGISFVALVIMLAQLFQNNLGSVIPYATAFMLMGLCILISLLAALLSVWGASGEKPLNILRYE
jgi:ABC-type antimicrobial peptide transport system permease subunit